MKHLNDRNQMANARTGAQEYKTQALDLKLTDEDESFHTFSAYASTFGNVDVEGDVIQRGAFAESLRHRTPKLLWQHDMSQPVGGIDEAMEDERGLYIRGRMPKDDSLVSGRLMPQLRAKSVDSMSIGFRVKDSERNQSGGRDFKALELFEVSFVTIPANPMATINSFKNVKGATRFQDLPLADVEREWSSDDAVDRVRRFVGAEDGPNEQYRRAFFWYDAEEADTFAAYKLPFADVIDGRLVAVPRGVFAAAAAMEGARGGVDIPDDDRADVEAHIARYYDKMDRDSPFENRSALFDSIDNLPDAERVIRRMAGLSKSDATAAVAMIKRCLRDAGGQTGGGEAASTANQDLSEGLSALREAIQSYAGKNHD